MNLQEALRAIALSLRDHSERIVIVPARLFMFGLDGSFYGLILFEQIESHVSDTISVWLCDECQRRVVYRHSHESGNPFKGRPVKYGNITPNWPDHRQILSRIANSDAAEARERMWRYVGAQVRDKHSDSGSARERAPRDNGN